MGGYHEYLRNNPVSLDFLLRDNLILVCTLSTPGRPSLKRTLQLTPEEAEHYQDVISGSGKVHRDRLTALMRRIASAGSPSL